PPPSPPPLGSPRPAPPPPPRPPPPVHPRPPYHPQRLALPASARAQFAAATAAAFLTFAVFGVFAGLAGAFLAQLNHTSPALAGLAIFLTFGAGVVVQTTT